MEQKYNLSELIYEDVNSEYGWGKYGEFRVLIRRKDGYINATKLCKDGGKELFHWNANENSKKLVEILSSVLGISRTGLIQMVNGGKHQEVWGTYVHPELIPHIASWISPKFAVMVSRIVNSYIVKQYREELYQKELELGKRKEKIDELMTEVKDLKESNKLLHQKLDLANENIIEAVRGVHQANRSICGVQSSLSSTADHSVPPEHVQRKDAETYAIYFCARENNKLVYTQCRARPFHLRRREAELRARYGTNFRTVVRINPVPNARTLASEFERRIEARGAELDLKYQTISLPEEAGALAEQEMVQIAREVFEERYEPAEEAKEVFCPVQLDIDEKTGRIIVDMEEPGEELEQKQQAEPTYQEQFAQLMGQRMDDLKATARTFPRDLKTFGGWSGKNKTELVEWILLRRRGVIQ